MSNTDNLDKSLTSLATVWTNYFEKQYDEKNYKLIRMLTIKSGLKNLDEDAEYSAGLLWTELYDLFGALADKSIKNIKNAEGFVELLAGGYQTRPESLWKILNDMSGLSMPHGIFIETYKLFDPNKHLIINDQEAIQGFTMISNSIWQNSNLGYLFDHAKELSF